MIDKYKQGQGYQLRWSTRDIRQNIKIFEIFRWLLGLMQSIRLEHPIIYSSKNSILGEFVAGYSLMKNWNYA